MNNRNRSGSRSAFGLLGVVVLVCAVTGPAHADADLMFPAYWPGSVLTEFLASDNYQSCRGVAIPAFKGTLDRLEFDSHDNLWLTASWAPLTKLLASERYARWETFDISQTSGIALDQADDLLVAKAGGGSARVANLIRLTSSSSYATRIASEIPDIWAADVAADAMGDLWLVDDWRHRYQVLELTNEHGASNPIRIHTDLRIRRIVATGNGTTFAVINAPDNRGLQIVRLKLDGSSLTIASTVADVGWDAGNTAVTVDEKGNLWALLQSWFGEPNKVVELLASSGYGQQKQFAIPRRVFGIAADAHANIWVTSPYKNVPYSEPWGRPSGFRPEDITELSADSGYSHHAALVTGGWPYGIAADGSGNIWTANGKADSGNVVELIASGGNGQQRTFNVPGQPYAAAVDKDDNVWVAGVFPGHNVAQLSRGSGYAVTRTLEAPRHASALALDPEQNLWIVDSEGYDYEISEFTAVSDYRKSQRYSVKGHPYGLAFDRSGNLWLAAAGCPRNRIVELLKADNYEKENSFPVDGRPYGVAVDGNGNVWAAVASQPRCLVTEFAPPTYAPSTKLALPAGYQAIGVDSHENVWLQSYDYVETDRFSRTPTSPLSYR